MKIELITQEQFDTLTDIQASHEILTFQPVGYQYIDHSKFTEADAQSFNKVEEILKAHIVGLTRFDNFQYDKKGRLKLRFQYNYGEEDNSMYFVGVGYMYLDELLNGFEPKL